MKKIGLYQCGGIVVEINDLRLLFDPWGRCDGKFDVIFVSHAHLDHVSGLIGFLDGSTPIYMTRETFEILRIQGVLNGNTKSIKFVKPGETIDIKNQVSIRFYNAGHVVGSIMFKLETPQVSIGYTGDFNFEENTVLSQAEIMHPDILLMDTTYGSPRYSFPPRSLLYEKIRELIRDILDAGKKPVLHGYALGKGQELTKVSSLFYDGAVSVDSRVGQINRIYEKYTKKSLGKYKIGESGDILVKGINKRTYRGGNHVHVYFTGWAMSNRFESAISIPLSSHTGFVKLLDYIVKNDPDIVYPLFGFEKSFSKFVKKDLGIKSEPLPRRYSEVYYSRSVRNSKRKYYGLDNFMQTK